jgi:uncharacterized protein YbjT (DUF2867 family)
MVRSSGLDWVIVQPVGLTDAQPKEEVLASPEGQVRHSTIPRRNVGRFLANAVSGDQFLRRSVALSA